MNGSAERFMEYEKSMNLLKVFSEHIVLQNRLQMSWWLWLVHDAWLVMVMHGWLVVVVLVLVLYWFPPCCVLYIAAVGLKERSAGLGRTHKQYKLIHEALYLYTIRALVYIK